MSYRFASYRANLDGIFDPENQREVLFDRNTKFTLTKQEQSGSTVWIEMTEL
jgi:hypothetical protein